MVASGYSKPFFACRLKTYNLLPNMCIAYTLKSNINIQFRLIKNFICISRFSRQLNGTNNNDHCVLQLSLSSPDKMFVQGVCGYITGCLTLRSSRRGVRLCNSDNENALVTVSVWYSGWPLVLADNPLCVGLVSNDTLTATEETPCSFMDLRIAKLCNSTAQNSKCFAYFQPNVHKHFNTILWE